MLLAGRAHATDYSVSPTGSDTASGQSGAPWATIQHAIGKVKAGDTVTVEDGTYAGLACDTVSGTAAAPIVFKSRNKWGAKITSATSGSSQDWVQFSSCSYITFDGFEVSGSVRSGIAILGNTDDGSDARGVVIQNCYSHNNGGTTVAGRHDGIFSGFALDLTIQDNTIDTTGEHGIYVSNSADNPKILRNTVSNTGANCIQINADVKSQVSGKADGLISNWRIEGNVVSTCKGAAGINLDGAIQGVASNNVIYNASEGGFTLFDGDGAEASHDNLIVNNTVYDPSGSRSAIQIADDAENNVVFNNIFVAKSGAFEIQTVKNLMHDYNIVSSFDGGSASAHESTVTTANAAALFAVASSGNLQLASGSAAIDKGVASYGSDSAPTTDVLGAARPAGAGYDLGAYEYGSTPPATGSGGTGTTMGNGGSAGSPGTTGSGGSATGGSGGKGGGAGGRSGGTGGNGGRPGTGGTATGTGGNNTTTGTGGNGGRSGTGGTTTTGTGGNNTTSGTGGTTTTGTGGNNTTSGAGGADPEASNATGSCTCSSAATTPSQLALEIVVASLAFMALMVRRRRRAKISRAR
ncbi:MAG TPA: right-handed parallel beta-helix repeat-containing protein [Polyangia bacterium]|nr:right-handed parallel beta-helix repeat-containing protein [Polyangia bacterium]